VDQLQLLPTMSTFHAVNTTLTVPEPAGRAGDETTPTTPRPNSRFFPESKGGEDVHAEDPSVKTPTRNSFAAGLAGQRPLPSSPLPARETSETPSTKSELSRGGSHRSTQSIASQRDIEMGEGDEDDKDGSENESVTSDTGRPSKKKKGQRFFCTEFPPCNLSFTRSEHLARHIRYVLSTSRPFTANKTQQAHRRTALPMPLLSEILAPRQPAPACPNGARQRGHTNRVPGRHRHALPETDPD
jgi:hypothetical protein